MMAVRWYVVQAFSGFEKQVRRSLQEHMRDAGVEDKFQEVELIRQGSQ